MQTQYDWVAELQEPVARQTRCDPQEARLSLPMQTVSPQPQTLDDVWLGTGEGVWRKAGSEHELAAAGLLGTASGAAWLRLPKPAEPAATARTTARRTSRSMDTGHLLGSRIKTLDDPRSEGQPARRQRSSPPAPAGCVADRTRSRSPRRGRARRPGGASSLPA